MHRDSVTASFHARRKRRTVAFRAKNKLVIPGVHDDIRIYNCDFRDLSDVAQLEDGSVKLVCSDVPYDKDWSLSPQPAELSQQCLRWLREDGIFTTMLGHWYLPEWLNALGSALTYQLVIALQFDVPYFGSTFRRGRRFYEHWKPIPVFTKAQHTKGEWHNGFHNLYKSASVPKNKYHPHQQAWQDFVPLINPSYSPG